jgi:hypothetical protein
MTLNHVKIKIKQKIKHTVVNSYRGLEGYDAV